MNTYRKTAVIVGLLFIIGTVSGILSGVVTAPVRAEATFPLNISANETQWIAGTLLVSLMGLSLAMVPVMLYPILKRRNEVLALGAVLFRGAIEVISYAVIVTSMLLMVSVSDLSQSAGAASAANFQFAGSMLAAANDWMGMWGALAFSIGAVMIYGAFYQTRLVPRWLSAWGFLGGVMYFACNLISLFSPHHVAPSLNGGIGMLMIPLAIQEMVFAVWMIVRGFNPSAVVTLSAKVETS